MNFWEKVKKDLQKGLKEGVEVMKEGATVVRMKAVELTEEARKQYRILDLKTKVQQEITELGGTVYDLSSKVRNPMLHRKVKGILARIGKLESRITKLEGKQKGKMKKPSPKRPVKAKNR